MRISSRVLVWTVLSLAGSPVSLALALDGQQVPANAAAPMPQLSNPRQALDAYRAGNTSIDVLRYAAEGEILAQWKLGSMYQAGEGGVPHDDVKAFEYFSRIVENYDEDDTDPREASAVSSAFVAIGVYSLTGIAGSRIRKDPTRALHMFTFAATSFGNPNAQYNLGRMFLDGTGVPKDPIQAARWLNLAADKNHTEAQALLGHLLFNGQNGVQLQRARGLAYLTLARDAASDRPKDAWIRNLHEKASLAASDNDRQGAVAYLRNFMRTGARQSSPLTASGPVELGVPRR